MYILEKVSRSSLKFFIWTKYEKDNNEFFKTNFKTSLLKCIKLQDSNAFSVKLNNYFLKIKDVYISKNPCRLKFNFFHLNIVWEK
jgi:hypothetical protein